MDSVSGRSGSPPLPRVDPIFDISRIATPDLSLNTRPRPLSHQSSSDSSSSSSSSSSSTSTSQNQSSASSLPVSASSSSPSRATRAPSPTGENLTMASTPESTLVQPPITCSVSSTGSPRSHAFTQTSPTVAHPTTLPGIDPVSGYRCISQRSVQPLDSQPSPLPKNTVFSPSAETIRSPVSANIHPIISGINNRHHHHHNLSVSTSISTSGNIHPSTSSVSNISQSASRANSTHKTSHSGKSRSHSKRGNNSHQTTSSSAATSSQSTSSDSLSLGDYLYHHGFLRGEGSDVTVRCFNKNFQLHRLILSRSPYFSSLFSTFWDTSVSTSSALPANSSVSSSSPTSPSFSGSLHSNGKDESSRVYTLSLSHDDNITERAFELALSRLYGHENPEEERTHVFGLFAVANFLDLPYLVDFCVTEIISRIGHQTVASILQFFYKCHYGEASNQIIESCKNFLFAEGYEMKMEYWSKIPNNIIAEVVGSDAFFVPTELDRCQFLIQLINWRMELAITNNSGTLTQADLDDIQPLRYALDNDIRYCHMTYDELDALENVCDLRNHLMISRRVLREALWLQTGLRQKVVRSAETGTELGIVRDIPEDKLYFNDSDDSDEGLDNSRDSQSASASPTGKVNHFDGDSPKTRSKRSQNGGEDDHFSGSSLDDGLYGDLSEEDDEITYFPVPASDETLDTHWERKNRRSTRVTKFPPFRFSVKFNDVTMLENDRRVYSQTYWYAGNYWNVYIQKVAYRHKHQLGVYIHRGPMEVDHYNTCPSLTIMPTPIIPPGIIAPPSITSGSGTPMTTTDFRRRSMVGGAGLTNANVPTTTNIGLNTNSRRQFDLEYILRAPSPSSLDLAGIAAGNVSGAGASLTTNTATSFDNQNETPSTTLTAGPSIITREDGVQGSPTRRSLDLSQLLLQTSLDDNPTNIAGTPATTTGTNNSNENEPLPANTIYPNISNLNGSDGDLTLVSPTARNGVADPQLIGDLFDTINQQRRTGSTSNASTIPQNNIRPTSTTPSPPGAFSIPNSNASSPTNLSARPSGLSISPNRNSNYRANANGSSTTGYGLPTQLQQQQQQHPPIPEYVDGRKKISAFFEIYTPSRKGHSSLTCFSSTPDLFNISQSWGWKSASLYLKAEELKKGGQNDGLKFMVSIGLV